MGDNIMKNDHASNFSYIQQNQTANMSVVPQLSTRPNTLPINAQRTINQSLFTPNDYNKLFLSTPEMDDKLRGYTTPDLINALSQPTMNDGQPSPGVKILDELITVHAHNNPIMSTPTSFDQVSYKIVSNTENVKQENMQTYHMQPRNTSPLSRNRSISSSMNDNDSSNSTSASSPLSSQSYLHSSRVKDELQHVPSMQGNSHGNPPTELVKREKKRERNRQAAQKCRTRKLTRIAELQKRVNELQGKNKDLTGIAECLKTDITKLEKQLQDHHTQGCTLMNGSVL